MTELETCCIGKLDTPCRFAPNANERMGSRGNWGYGQENTLKQWRAINESHVLPKVEADTIYLSVYTSLCSDVLSHYLVTIGGALTNPDFLLLLCSIRGVITSPN